MSISIGWIFFIAFLTLYLNLYWEPIFPYTNFLQADRSVFAVAGKLINEGKLPYRDFWDHKPPAIFYVDALIIRLMGISLWSFWWSNIFWLALTTIILFLFLRKLTSTFPAVLASGVFLVTFMDPGFYGGGNLPETYAALPQILIIAVSFLLFSTGRRRWAFTGGILTGIAFLFKQTCIAPGIGIFLALLYLGIRTRNLRKAIEYLIWFSLGVIAPLGAILVIWTAVGAFSDLWDAVVAYNLLYVKGGFSFGSLIVTLRRLFIELPLMPITFAVIGAGVAYIIDKGKQKSSSSEGKIASKVEKYLDPAAARQNTFLAVFLALPFSIALVTLGGLNLLHYYNALVPLYVVASVYLIEQLAHPKSTQDKIGVLRVISTLGFVLLAIVLVSHAYVTEKPRAGVRRSLSQPLYGALPQSDLARYILDHTQPDDSILIWGNDIDLYLFTNRRVPSRYLYPQPLFQPIVGPESRFAQFLQDIKRDPPVLIFDLDTNTSGLPTITVPDAELCPQCIPEAVMGMKQLKDFVSAHYILVPFDATTNLYQRVH